MHKHTAHPTVRSGRNRGLLCSQRREELLIIARRPAVMGGLLLVSRQPPLRRIMADLLCRRGRWAGCGFRDRCADEQHGGINPDGELALAGH